MPGGKHWALVVGVAASSALKCGSAQVALVDYEALAGTIPGTAFPDEDFECVEYPGGYCELVYPKGTPVYKHKGFTLDEMDTMLREIEKTNAQTASGSCLESQMRLSCASWYGACSDMGSGIALKNLPCQDMCIDLHEQCPALMVIRRQLGLGVGIQNCGIEEFSNTLDDPRPDTFGWKVQLAFNRFPSMYLGQSVYPKTHSIGPGGQHVPCSAKKELYSGQFQTPALDCKSPLVQAPDKKQCLFPCPHPLYSPNEYASMWDAYVYISIPGGVLAIALAINCFRCYIYSHKLKKMRAYCKTPNFRYQAMGSAGCVLYTLSGPWLVWAFNEKSTFGMTCSSNVDYETWKPTSLNTQSVPCFVNKCAVFFLMIPLNILAVHLFHLYGNFRVLSMNEDAKKRHSQWMTKAIAWAELAAFGVPLFCMITALALDGVDHSSPAYAGLKARWTPLCGARLEFTEEVCLIFVPLIFSGIFISIFAARVFRQVSKQIAEMVREKLQMGRVTILSTTPTPAEISKTSKHNPVLEAMHSLGTSLSCLGMIVSVLVVVFVVLTATGIHSVNTLSASFYDYLFCETIYKGKSNNTASYAQAGILKSGASSCHDLDIKSIDGQIAGRPSVFIMALILAAQDMIPLLFASFYTMIALSKRHMHASLLKQSKSGNVTHQPSSTHVSVEQQ